MEKSNKRKTQGDDDRLIAECVFVCHILTELISINITAYNKRTFSYMLVATTFLFILIFDLNIL